MIPRLLYQIWIGPYNPPSEWMESWRRAHPGWIYKILDNEVLTSRHWKLQRHIDEFLRRGDYAGVSDMMRYEVLYETGGAMMPADAECLRPIDALFVGETAYAARENDIYCPNSLTPVLAAPAGDPFLAEAIDEISRIDPKNMGTAWVTTGNLLMGYLASHHPDAVTILSSRTFVPRHYSGIFCEPDENTYAMEHFGSTRRIYSKSASGLLQRLKMVRQRRAAKRYRRRAERAADPKAIPWLNMDNWP